MRAMVSPALPALTVLTARIERLGQSCARAAGAKVIRTAHAVAPHHVRNDIDTSLECRRSSVDFVDGGFVGRVFRWPRFRWSWACAAGGASHAGRPCALTGA